MLDPDSPRPTGLSVDPSPSLPLRREPWRPQHLGTRSGGRIQLLVRLGHTWRDWWVECDVVGPNGQCQRAVRLHPAQIIVTAPGGAAASELHQLHLSVRRYLETHGHWRNARWEPHNTPGVPRSWRLRKARRQRVRDRQQRWL